MRLTLTTNDGIIIEVWRLDEWDLTKQMARSLLAAEIADAVSKQEPEKKDG